MLNVRQQRSITLRYKSHQGRNGGEKGAQFPGCWVNMGRRKVLKMSQVLSSIRWICFRKSSGSNIGRQTCFLPWAPSNLVTPLRATQNMSARCNSPTIGVNLRGLPLSAVTDSLHYLPKCLRSTVTCDKTPTTVTWNASSKICCLVIVTQHRPIVEQFTREFRNLLLQAKKRI